MINHFQKTVLRKTSHVYEKQNFLVRSKGLRKKTTKTDITVSTPITLTMKLESCGTRKRFNHSSIQVRWPFWWCWPHKPNTVPFSRLCSDISDFIHLESVKCYRKFCVRNTSLPLGGLVNILQENCHQTRKENTLLDSGSAAVQSREVDSYFETAFYNSATLRKFPIESGK